MADHLSDASDPRSRACLLASRAKEYGVGTMDHDAAANFGG